MCHPSRKLRYPCTSHLQLKGVLARDATATVWVMTKAGADVEVKAAHRLQMPCAAPEPLPGGGTGQLPAAPGGQSQRHNAEFLDIYKQQNNWNVCFSCRFDVEDVHTSGTCPFKKWNHQVSYTRNNAQQ